MLQTLPSEDRAGKTASGPLPNFLIIGAAKAGTSSLYFYLKQHPDIFMSPIKETNFFLGDDERGAPTPGGREEGRRKVTDLAAYRGLFRGAVAEKARGEASPKYLYYPETAQRIQATLPDATILVILRHPVDRAYSDFLHKIRDNQEELTDFAAALRAEPARIDKGWPAQYHYRGRGFYSQQLRPYYAAFGPERVHVFLYEDLQRAPGDLMRRMFGVLGVDPAFVPDVKVKHNISGVPKNRLLHEAYRFLGGSDHSSFMKVVGKHLLPARLRGQIKAKVVRDLRKDNLYKPPLRPEVREDLLSGYRDDTLELQDLIGRDLTHWLE